MTPKSTHLPEVSGDIVSVTGSLVVKTGLRDIQTFVAAFAQALTPATAEATLSRELLPQAPGAQQEVEIKTYLLAGTPGVTPTKVSWLAVGR